MADDPSVDLVDRWRSGDQRADAALVDRYAGRLVALAAARLPGWVAARVGPEDVVQSAYGAFFAGARDGRFVLERSGDLWRLLVTLTGRKARDQWRRYAAGKRGGRPADEVAAADAPARDPSPADAAALADTVAALLAGLEPLDRRVVELRLQGYEQGEIAAAVGCTRPFVRRVLDQSKDRLRALAAHPDHPHLEVPPCPRPT